MSLEFLGIGASGVSAAAGVIGGTAATPGLDGLLQELWKLSPTRIPNLENLIGAYRRGIISRAQLYELGARNGWREENINSFLELTKVIPNVSDQVRFVVKEAYTPELIQDLVKGEPTPEKFIERMSVLGVDKEDSDRYWLSHYDPLGRTEFEEMFHRLNPRNLKFKNAELNRLGLNFKDIAFDENDLSRMYKIRDVYPGLRDRLKLISYKPLSRIDIRRLEDFGLLSKEELIYRNEEIGYSPSDAEFLARWTLINNAFKDIKALMKQNAIGKEEAIKMLIAAGATKDDAERLILRTLPIVKKEKLAKERDLTRSIFEDAYELGIDSRKDFVNNLIDIGYDSDEAELVAKIADKKLDTKKKTEKKRSKDLTKTDIEDQFELGQISRSEYMDGLESIGYDSDEAAALVKITEAEIAKKEKKKK